MSTDDWDPDRMMNGSYGSGMYGGGLAMMVLVLLLVVLVGALAWWLARSAIRSDDRATTAPPPAGIGSPRDLLDQRLARGEITPEDYRATRQLLET